MEDEDRLFADDHSAEKTQHVDTQQNEFSNMQDNIMKMAQSMSQAWAQIVQDKETAFKGAREKRRGRNTLTLGNRLPQSKRGPSNSESKENSSDDDGVISSSDRV